ncbi:lysozyme inhibitor LprI family protein [Pseudomonas yamanorum]
MRSVKLICFWLAVYLPLSAFATSPPALALGERTLREECSAFSEAGMRDCLEKKSENSQKALRQAEGKVASTLQKWDEDAKYISQAKAKLTASNKDFAKYRDSQCEFLASLSGGAAGNAHEIGRLACVAELNNRRVEQLHEAISNLPLK